MNRKLNFVLSLAAGLLGGILSHYIAPELVLAQAQAVPPKEITAQSFVLVNGKGVPFGEFGFEKDGIASIKLLDRSGRVVWSQDGKPNPRQLAADISK
jgi:hypothetical protein